MNLRGAKDETPSKGTRILEAAVRVLAVKGFEATRVEEIAREACVGKGTVYEYFDSKEHLFAEAVKQATLMYADMIVSALDAGDTLRKSLGNALSSSLIFARTSRHSAQVLLDNPGGRARDSVKHWLWGLRQELVEEVARTIIRHRGENAGPDPRIAAAVFLGALSNLSLAQLLDDPGNFPGSVERITEEVLAVILDGLGRDR
ncbi:MAG: TetR/AcrR family transcriptional regulator [Clostridia bacterium]